MRIRFLILFLLAANVLYAQHTLQYDSTISFIKSRGIKINSADPPPGFTVYYNCDSLLFMKGIFGDTIKVWTPAMDWYQDLEEFKNILKDEGFGSTEFVKSIDPDGRIYVSSYHETVFIYRHDSLFEMVNSNPAPSGPVTVLFSDFFNQKIDKQTYESRLDSLQQTEKKQAVYTPKLIFAKKMFQQNRKQKLPKHLNFMEDTIALEKQWVQQGKTCYLVRISNTEEGQETSYAFAFNQDMRFVFWESCDKK